MSDTVTIDGKVWRLVDPIITRPRHPAPGVTHRLTANLVETRPPPRDELRLQL